MCETISLHHSFTRPPFHFFTLSLQSCFFILSAESSLEERVFVVTLGSRCFNFSPNNFVHLTFLEAISRQSCRPKFFFSLVLSPRSDSKHGDVVSTSTDSGSVIIDMVGRIKTSERIGGRDSGMLIHCIPGRTEFPLLLQLLSLSQDAYTGRNQVPFAWKRELCS